jgi:hypothetical protein
MILPVVFGCAPVFYDYYRPHFPGGELRISGKCAGPKDTVYFEYGAISVAVRIMGLREFSVVYYVPDGITARLMSDDTQLLMRSPHGETSRQVKLAPVNREHLESTTAPMIGYTRTMVIWFVEKRVPRAYFFEALRKPILEEESGTLVLPDMEINGAMVSGPRVSFRKDRSLEFDAFNC